MVDYYREAEPNTFDADRVLSIGVCYDGTWAKPGFTSRIGDGAAIEVTTGLVVDFHVKSSH